MYLYSIVIYTTTAIHNIEGKKMTQKTYTDRDGNEYPTIQMDEMGGLEINLSQMESLDELMGILEAHSGRKAYIHTQDDGSLRLELYPENEDEEDCSEWR